MPPAAAASGPTKPPTSALVKETGNWEKSLCALVEHKEEFASNVSLLTTTAARLNEAWAQCIVSKWRLFDYTVRAFQKPTPPDREKLQSIIARWNNGELPTEVSPPAAVPAPVTKQKASAAANTKAPTATEAGRKAGSTKKASASKEADAPAPVESKKKKVVKSAPIVKSDTEADPVPPPKSGPPKARPSAAAKPTAEGKSSGKSKAAPPPEPSEEGDSDEDEYVDEEKSEEEAAPLKHARARAAGSALAKISKKHAPKVTTWTEADEPCANCKKVAGKCMVAEDLTERQGAACQACKNKKQRCPFAKLNTMGLETPVPVALFARFNEEVDLVGAEEVEEGCLMTVGELLTGIYLTSRLIRDQNWQLQRDVEALQDQVNALEETVEANQKDARAAVDGLEAIFKAHEEDMDKKHEEVRKLVLSRAPRPLRPTPGEPSTRQRPPPPVDHVNSTETGAQETAPQSAQPVRQLPTDPAPAESAVAAPAPPPNSSAPNKGASPPLVPALEDHGAAASALLDSQATAPPGAPSPTDSSITQADTSVRPLPDIGDDVPPVAGSSKRKASRVSADPAPALTPAKRKDGPEESDREEEEEDTPQPPVPKKAKNGKGTAGRTRSGAGKR